MSAKNFISGWLVANQIMNLQMVKKDAPVLATQYLYGSPSDSGNIGLRSGDTVSYYDGAVLPKAPDEIMAYSYVYIYEDVESKQYIAYGFDTKPYAWMYENFLTSYETVKVDSGTYGSACWYSTVPEEWSGIETNKNVSDAALGYIRNKPSTIIWSNFDMNALDGTLALAASDPIPVSGLVGYIGDIPVYEVFK